MLLLTWLGLVLGIAAFLYGVALFAQRAIYEQVADYLPLRALAAGLLVGSVLAGWALANQRADYPGKYGTLLDFSASHSRELDGFDAVRRLRVKDENGNPREQVVRYRRDGLRMVDDDNREFRRASPDFMTVAILVPDGDTQTRYAVAEKDGAFVLTNSHAIYREEGGSRTITDESPRLVNVPSLRAAVGAVAFNLLHFVAWFVAFWPILRFTVGPSIVATLILGTASMFVLVPMLFQSLPRGVA